MSGRDDRPHQFGLLQANSLRTLRVGGGTGPMDEAVRDGVTHLLCRNDSGGVDRSSRPTAGGARWWPTNGACTSAPPWQRWTNRGSRWQRRSAVGGGPAASAVNS